MNQVRLSISGSKPISTWLGVALLAVSTMAHGQVPTQPLSLERAQALALQSDPSVESVRARGAALGELEVAAGELPDPMVRMGLMSLPTDSFQLGQEPMTQVLVGVVQKFPRGDSRALRQEQIRERAAGLDKAASDLELRILLSVREEFIEVAKQQRLAEINQQAAEAFGDLAQITEDYYATGRVQQQDVLRASVELAKVEERSSRIGEAEENARARLSAWLPDHAWDPLEREWPELPQPRTREQIIAALANHPRLLALHQEVIAAETGIEISKQNYKPEFAVDVSYGGRGGMNADGSSRSDLFSVMVMMDVPLFRENRQDRLAAASVAESSAIAYQRDDAYRMMKTEVAVHSRTLQRQLERLALFENEPLPEAEFNASAALDSYQAALADLTTLMRARITEFDLQLDYARLQADALKTRARLLYLQGETS